ncbi:MAG TPA: CPBP family intramembrane glutamic endopeptidase [Pseudolabrys sp.]|jgi:membrane protease YdiL (CAAX protease family)|nr:CPBP family intramembrane glutamic endopeptidase [Pseudolabrys sp.]
MTPWGRFSSLGLAAVALLAGQMIALAALTWWFGLSLLRLPNLTGDGVAVTIIILVSTPIEVALLMLFSQRTGTTAADYLGWTMPKRADVVFGLAVVAIFIVVADVVSWLAGHGLVTSFQTDIYSTASSQGWLVLLWFAIMVVTPFGEETLFRGFLFRGWFREPKDAWFAIIGTGVLFALLHVQYDWFVIAQVCAFGILLGWMRWVSGSTILTMLLHGFINFEGMIETVIGLHR